MDKEKIIDKLIEYKNSYFDMQDYEFASCLRSLELDIKSMEVCSYEYFLLKIRDLFYRYNRDFKWLDRDLTISKK